MKATNQYRKYSTADLERIFIKIFISSDSKTKSELDQLDTIPNSDTGVRLEQIVEVLRDRPMIGKGHITGRRDIYLHIKTRINSCAESEMYELVERYKKAFEYFHRHIFD